MPTLTIFTPTYNRAHLLRRVYESLVTQTCQDFEWLVIDDGSTDFTRSLVEGFMREGRIAVSYVHKENGGLHTGYNEAYSRITSELCVCIDSDDFMPDDAVEIIIRTWRERGGEEYAGLIGLDLFMQTMEPIGGRFPERMTQCYYPDLRIRGIHKGDVKVVTRTDLMKCVAPQSGFEGEKNFNPVYMLLQVTDKIPMLIINKPLCIVDYQEGGDSMSAGIYRQYLDSPRSFAKLRRLEMSLTRATFKDKLRTATHYVSSCCIAKESNWLSASPCPILTLLMSPAGWLLSKYIIRKAKEL